MIQIKKREYGLKKDGITGVGWVVKYRDSDGKRRRASFKSRSAAEAKRNDLMRAYGRPDQKSAYGKRQRAGDMPVGIHLL